MQKLSLRAKRQSVLAQPEEQSPSIRTVATYFSLGTGMVYRFARADADSFGQMMM